MPDQHIAARFVRGLGAAGLFTCTNPDGVAFTGYASPNIQAAKLVPQVKVDRIPNQDGQTASILIADEIVQCTFDFIVSGADSAKAVGSAYMPVAGATFTLTGFTVLKFGPFADVFNNAAGEAPWIYLGEAGIDGFANEKWEGQYTLFRFPSITNATAVS